MIVSTCQPYFAPYPGFFAKIMQSDACVLMDSVQFPQGTTWLTRNRFKGHQGTLWMTIPVWKKGLGLQKISEVTICHEGGWRRKHLESLKTVYAHAPFFGDHQGFLETIFSGSHDRLTDVNLAVIEYLVKHLGIKARLVLLSELEIDGKEPELTMVVCKRLGATHFLAQKSAQKYLDAQAFRRDGVELLFFNTVSPVYPQLWGAFIPNLSVFDLLFNCGPRSEAIIRKSIKQKAVL